MPRKGVKRGRKGWMERIWGLYGQGEGEGGGGWRFKEVCRDYPSLILSTNNIVKHSTLQTFPREHGQYISNILNYNTDI